MWRRLMRRSLAPRRPVAYEQQIPLIVVTAVVVIASIVVVAYAITSV